MRRTWNFASWPVILALFASSVWASAQSGSDIRSWMLENDADFYSTIQHFGIDSDTAVAALGFENSWSIAQLGFLWTSCVLPTVSLQGSAESIGLTDTGLNGILGLRLRNDLSFLPRCGNDYSEPKNESMLFVDLAVWTVGDDYPVAYHVELTTYQFSMVHSIPRQFNEPFTTAYLGYARSTDVSGELNKIIEEIVRDMAISYVRATGQ